VCAKFDGDRLGNEKALADRKSESDNSNTNNKNNVVVAWEPVLWSKKLIANCEPLRPYIDSAGLSPTLCALQIYLLIASLKTEIVRCSIIG